MLGHGEASVRSLEVAIARETLAFPTQSLQIRTRVKENAFLPEAVKAFHSGVAAGLFLGDKAEMDSQKEVESEDLGETVAISTASRGRHLVIHLGDTGQAYKSPGSNKMEAN